MAEIEEKIEEGKSKVKKKKKGATSIRCITT